MLSDKLIEVSVTGGTLRWYRDRGYQIPTHIRQLYAIVNGVKKKNGKMISVKEGTKIFVKPEDLPPSSNKKVELTCPRCGSSFTTTYGAYRKKINNLCGPCVKRKIKGNGSHSYWVKKLITLNPDAKCDISGETDKRFLVLHHLNSVSSGGINSPDNYVILSANYHLAFHVWAGGMDKLCTKAQYLEFKANEIEK